MHSQISTENLTPHDRLQIEMAARGCIDGTLAEWSDLNAAFKAAGVALPPATVASVCTAVCKLILQLDDVRAGRWDGADDLFVLNCECGGRTTFNRNEAMEVQTWGGRNYLLMACHDCALSGIVEADRPAVKGKQIGN